MKLALGGDLSDETLQFAKQLGVGHLVAHGLPDSGRGYWEFIDLLRAKKRLEMQGLELAVLGLPQDHYWNVVLGRPERDQEIENVCRSIQGMGQAGIPVLAYSFMFAGVWGHWRGYGSGGGRGDAGIKSFDYDLVKDAPLTSAGEVSGDEMWARFTYFLERIVPVAEEAGVRLACHPHDPPVPVLRGETRILGTVEGLKRLVETVPSPSNGLNFCQGTVAEMGVDVIEVIRYFGERDKINTVHFRNVRGTVPKFDEVFIDEGDVDMFKAMQTYKEVGYERTMIPDHTPRVVGDSSRGHRGRAFALGYMRALMQVVGSL